MNLTIYRNNRLIIKLHDCVCVCVSVWNNISYKHQLLKLYLNYIGVCAKIHVLYADSGTYKFRHIDGSSKSLFSKSRNPDAKSDRDSCSISARLSCGNWTHQICLAWLVHTGCFPVKSNPVTCTRKIGKRRNFVSIIQTVRKRKYTSFEIVSYHISRHRDCGSFYTTHLVHSVLAKWIISKKFRDILR